MEWELFDPAVMVPPEPPLGPLVRVGTSGRLLFSWRAWDLLGRLPGEQREIILLFDRDQRVAGVCPALPHRAPASVRLTADAMRSRDWPYGLRAESFVDHYEIGVGDYPARVLVGPMPQMLTFEVGTPRRRPAGVPPFGGVEEDLEDVGEVSFRDETQPRRPVGVPPFGGNAFPTHVGVAPL